MMTSWMPYSRRMRSARSWGELISGQGWPVTTSFGENMELTAPGVNKGSAVQALCARLGLGPDQVMAFGDAGNDLELLGWAGWSFAMGNASDEAKAVAHYTTGTNREGGVGMAVEQYLLNA